MYAIYNIMKMAASALDNVASTVTYMIANYTALYYPCYTHCLLAFVILC